MTYPPSRPTIMLALLTLILLQGCANHSSEKSITQFWTWFTNEYAAAPVLGGSNTIDGANNKITERLQTINRGLSSQIGITDGKKQTLIVSADGNKKLFPLVKQIVKEAPTMTTWRAVTFKPRVEKLTPVESDGVIVSPEDIFFTAQPHDGVVDICVLLDHTIPPATAEKIAILMLDQALGEYEASEKIGKITFAPITELNEDNSNFRELRKAVDDYCK